MENNLELDMFINDILDVKGLSGVDDEVRQQLKTDMQNELLDQINRALIGAMPDERIDGFNQLLDADPSHAKLESYIVESGVDVKKVTIETMLRFRALYLGAEEKS